MNREGYSHLKYAVPPRPGPPGSAPSCHLPPMNGCGSLPRRPTPNVIVFGETGAGKSSVLNMLDGDDKANVCNKADGVTFSNQRYEKMISGSNIRVFDTVGLNEGSAGTVAPRDAVVSLYNLISQLEHGVNLLVFVMRAPRIKATTKQNYDMFFRLFCGENVPIVIVITGLEGEENMDQWWDENKAAFDHDEMSFSGSACVTATKGKLRDGVHCLAAEYEESKKKIEALISRSLAKEGWKMATIPWFTSTVVQLRNIFATALGCEPKVLAQVLYQALRQYAGLSKRQAKDDAYKVEKSSFQKLARQRRYL